MAQALPPANRGTGGFDIPPVQFPGSALAAELYLEAGIRSFEMGTLIFGKRGEDGMEHAGPMDLLRLAIPRRVYTQSHFDYVIEAVHAMWRRRARIRGLELIYQSPRLRHFTARFCWTRDSSTQSD